MSRSFLGNRRRGARLGWALAGLAVACSCAPTRPVRPAPAATGRPADLPGPDTLVDEPGTTAAVVAAHNAERARRRLPPLAVNAELSAAARAHANEMARRGRMSHRGADGSSPFDRIERAGYDFRAAAENVAAGYDRVDEVMAGWMRSPGHRRNILGPTAEIGVGHAVDPAGASYWCVTFGTPRAAVSRRGPESSAMLRQVAARGNPAGRGG